MSELRERVYNFMKVTGPVVPMQVAKYIESDSFLASAVLSELLNAKRAKISNATLGSSKVYYIPGQEEKVGELLYPHLKPREKDAFDLLKEQSVLKDRELEPWCRVALRDLKDFAVPFIVETKESKEIFWKYYLVEDTVASDLIQKGWMNVEEKELQTDTPSIEPVAVKEEAKEEVIPEFEAVDANTEEIVQLPKKKVLTDYSEPKKVKLEGGFYNRVCEYFSKNNINIINESLIKKNKEFAFTVSVPSNIGNITMFVYAKDKNSISENDIALGCVEAQRKNMICLLLSNGSVGKKIQELLSTKYYGAVIFKKLK